MTDQMDKFFQELRQEYLAEAPARLGELRKDAAARELGLPVGPRRSPAFGWRAHLVGGAADLAARLAAALRESGYSVTLAPLDADPSRIPASERPELAVLLPGADEDPREAVERWTTGAFERRIAVALVADLEGPALLQAPFARLDLVASPPRADAMVSRWARATARVASSPALVLIASGDPAERASLTTWLEDAGLRLTATGSAEQADEAARKESPDLILVDLALPDGAGLALARLLRRDHRMALTPVLAIMSTESDAEREGALEAGVDELLPRPLTHGRVVPTIVLRAGRYAFFTTRNVALARAIGAPSAFTKHCAKHSVPPVLITSLSTVSHSPICALSMKSMAMPTVTSETAPRN